MPEDIDLRRSHAGCRPAPGLPGLLLLTAILGAAGGCAAQRVDPSTPVPDRLTLKLRAAMAGNRFTYFELAPDGQLSFGGGRDAALSIGRPVTVLTDVQRRQLWDLIVQYRLLEAKGELFPQGEQVTYDLTVNAGAAGTTIRCADEKVAGVRQLHEALFKMQADVRYDHPAIK